MHARIAPRYTAEDTYIANLVGALNQIACGATTIFDWCHNNATPAHSDAAIDGLEESGIRAVFGHGSPKPDADQGAPPFTHIPHPRSEIERLRKGRLSSDDARVTLAMAALGPDFSTYEVTEHDFPPRPRIRNPDQRPYLGRSDPAQPQRLSQAREQRAARSRPQFGARQFPR